MFEHIYCKVRTPGQGFDSDEPGGKEPTIDEYVDFAEEEGKKMKSNRLKGM